MELRPGVEVTPNVRLESCIGKGSKGEVWLAEHVTLQTKVAVKFLLERLDPDDPEQRERFIREASSAVQIIVSITTVKKIGARILPTRAVPIRSAPETVVASLAEQVIDTLPTFEQVVAVMINSTTNGKVLTAVKPVGATAAAD